MAQIDVQKLLEKEEVGSRFALCSIVSKRARQLNDAAHFAERDCKDVLNERKCTISIDKPVLEAVEELENDKLTIKR